MIRAAIVMLAMMSVSARAEVHPEIVTLDAQPTLARTVRTTPEKLVIAITSAVLALVTTSDQQTLQIVGPPYARYITRGKQLQIEVGVPLRKPVTAQLGMNMRAGQLPAGRAAVLVVKGKHEQLPAAHAALERWLGEHGEAQAGPRWEVYVTNPITTPDPAAQETRIVAPLKARSR